MSDAPASLANALSDRYTIERLLGHGGMATVAARLSNPHIAPLIDSGESDGSLYYISPYIPGGSLRDRLNREQKLPIDDGDAIVKRMKFGAPAA